MEKSELASKLEDDMVARLNKSMGPMEMLKLIIKHSTLTQKLIAVWWVKMVKAHEGHDCDFAKDPMGHLNEFLDASDADIREACIHLAEVNGVTINYPNKEVYEEILREQAEPK